MLINMFIAFGEFLHTVLFMLLKQHKNIEMDVKVIYLQTNK